MFVYASELRHEARKVIMTIPHKEIKISRSNPFAFAVAKSVHNPSWTART